MSDNGKGSNTAKRTNFKKFNEGWDKINWNGDVSYTNTKLPDDIADRIAEISDKLDTYDTNSSS